MSNRCLSIVRKALKTIDNRLDSHRNAVCCVVFVLCLHASNDGVCFYIAIKQFDFHAPTPPPSSCSFSLTRALFLFLILVVCCQYSIDVKFSHLSPLAVGFCWCYCRFNIVFFPSCVCVCVRLIEFYVYYNFASYHSCHRRNLFPYLKLNNFDFPITVANTIPVIRDVSI